LPAGAISRSIVPGRDKPVLDGGGIPWITVADLDGLYVAQSKAGISVSKRSLAAAGGRIIPKGAVILSCVGEFGLASIASDELTMNQQLHAFQTELDVLPEWLAYNIHRQKRHMERIATQTTIKYLNKKGCESIPVCLPSMTEQRLLCQFVLRADQAICRLGDSSQKLKRQKLGLMQDLLTGKVPVKVGAGGTAIAG
jgi:type I restriction enzyme S subunit